MNDLQHLIASQPAPYPDFAELLLDERTRLEDIATDLGVSLEDYLIWRDERDKQLTVKPIIFLGGIDELKKSYDF